VAAAAAEGTAAEESDYTILESACDDVMKRYRAVGPEKMGACTSAQLPSSS
jgi:hypothetical protein